MKKILLILAVILSLTACTHGRHITYVIESDKPNTVMREIKYTNSIGGDMVYGDVVLPFTKTIDLKYPYSEDIYSLVAWQYWDTNATITTKIFVDKKLVTTSTLQSNASNFIINSIGYYFFGGWRE